MPLSDPEIKKAKPADKPRKLADGGGLYLLVAPTGGKLWRLKYRFGGKEKMLSFGTYPEITLARTRGKREEAKRQLAEGIDPGELKKALKTQQAERAANSFEAIAPNGMPNTRRAGQSVMRQKSCGGLKGTCFRG